MCLYVSLPTKLTPAVHNAWAKKSPGQAVMPSTSITEIRTHKELRHVEYVPAEKGSGCLGIRHQRPWHCTIHVRHHRRKLSVNHKVPWAKLRTSGLDSEVLTSKLHA